MGNGIEAERLDWDTFSSADLDQVEERVEWMEDQLASLDASRWRIGDRTRAKVLDLRHLLEVARAVERIAWVTSKSAEYPASKDPLAMKEITALLLTAVSQPDLVVIPESVLKKPPCGPAEVDMDEVLETLDEELGPGWHESQTSLGEMPPLNAHFPPVPYVHPVPDDPDYKQAKDTADKFRVSKPYKSVCFAPKNPPRRSPWWWRAILWIKEQYQ